MSELNEQVKNQIDDVFARQQCYALELRKSDCKQRLAVLDRFEQAFRESEEKIYQSAADDFSKPQAEVDMSEIMAVLAELKHVRKNLKKWMKPISVMPTASMIGTSSKIVKEPKGVTLVVSPWNYPFNLTFGPMIWSIAAGNTVIIKPSEMTPNMSAVIADIVERAFRPEEVSLFQGEADVASYLTALPFDHIFFTGSPAVGKHVMAAAAKNLTSVTLELGGKSPVVLSRSADLEQAIERIMVGKTLNAGQICLAPDYVLVPEEQLEEVIRIATATVANMYPSLLNNEQYTSVVNERHHTRLSSYVADAEQRGCRVIPINPANEDFSAGTHKIPPTLVIAPENAALCMEEEIFGPLLPIIGYTDLDQVIASINAGPKPLAYYIYSQTNANIDKTLTQITSGGACVNHSLLQFLQGNLPFGGVNNSGIGRAHGHYGFKEFSHERGVVKTQFDFAAMLMMPGQVLPIMRKALRMGFKFL